MIKQKYSSGRPRVHKGVKESKILKAIAEYEVFDDEDKNLVSSVRETAVDLREELELRKKEEEVMAAQTKKQKKEFKASNKMEEGSLGSIIWWNLREIEVAEDDLKGMFTKVGLNPGKYVRQIISRNAFLRALKELETDRIIRRVDEDKGKMIYQFTQEYLEKQELKYKFELQIHYLKATKLITCTNKKMMKHVQALVNVKSNTYRTGDITRFVQKIFREEGDILGLRAGGSIYFVPINYKELVEKVGRLLNMLGGQGSLKAYPISVTDSSAEDIKKTFADEGQEIIEKIKGEIGEISKVEDSKRNRLVNNRAAKLVKLKKRAMLYRELLKFQFEDLDKAIDKTSRVLVKALSV